MNAIIDVPPAAPPATVPGLLLHCGAEMVSREELAEVPTPRPTDTWFPLAHRDLVTEVECQLLTSGFEIKSMVHSLSHDRARYFGILQVNVPDREVSDYAWVVGLRNSHDKTYPAGMVAGTQVFVCDNLAFTGEVRLSRKHTRHASRDLRHLTARAVGKLGDRFHNLDRRISAYRGRHVSDWAAHDLVIRAIDCRAITTTQVPQVLTEWRKPSHLQFEHRTAWSLFNAFTEVHKRVNPNQALPRGEALYGLFDAFCGVI
ncbi:DUF932 domain-containing protein [Haloferula sp. BvORR071]|uniref:DUF932 domain-containing protein n=1 Tax=Haloferula sp. BvORR071 TaxID=1396141 RepID=UPI000698E2DE|nr:DUF932 domain-containing protein [Haloferula sp. BvORR071]